MRGGVQGGLEAFRAGFGGAGGFVHQAHGGARDIDGHVAATDHDDPLAEFDFVTQIGIDQEIDAVKDAGQMRAGNVPVRGPC